ncbi:jhy protein homolog [Melopsittacus undulatus]|uniref:jhy protein homolog n=1 Tax=Melopsittacus undulatus TaxID=13146 RepID=UPI00146DC0D7|nr:jhy protein homolog [Melopsittacus undulatus]
MLRVLRRGHGNGETRRSGSSGLWTRISAQYNSNWKNTKGVIHTCHVAEGSSMDFIQEPFYLHFKEDKNQQEAKSEDSLSEFGTKSLSFHEPNAVVSNEPFRLHTKGKKPAENCHCEGSSRIHGGDFPLQIQEDQPQRAKKDFVARNKRTLGLRPEIDSYLQLHTKKQEALQKQVADPKAVDEEPLKRVLPFQTVKIKPEDKWYLKAQHPKIHPLKSCQRNNIKSNQRLKERAIPRNDSQQQPGRPAELRPLHHQTPGSQTSPTQAVQQDNSSALHPSPSVGPGTNTAANSDTCLNNSPSSRHLVNRDITTFTHPFPPKSHTFNPAEVISPAYTSKESWKYQHNCPNGLPRGQQHLHNTVQLFARGNSTNGQAHPNQRNIPSTFNANFQELVKDQESLQDCKRHICVDKRYQNCYQLPQSSIHSSPTGPCTTSQFAPTMERYHQGDTHLTDVHSADRHFFRLLPPINPQVESVSEVNPESVKGNQVKKPQSNSEVYIMQIEKQNQPKVSKKPCTSKAYINLNVKLGGLGPDYEAIKEKKEKLKQQKEYAKQIKERNMKSIASVPRLPTKPQGVTSVSRQKALEYAKKIPRPKTFTTKPSAEKVKEERVLPQTLNGDILPQIASLETLQDRHQKEKQVVAAFKNLRILQVF